MPKRLFAILLLVSLLLPALSAGQEVTATATGSSDGRWLGPGQRPLPFKTDAEVLAFLRKAKVVTQKELTGGVNRPLKVGLRGDGVEANAIFRVVDVRLKRAKLDGMMIADFHDSYVYECAAWEVSRLLGIDNVPPCTRRRYELTDGSMQLWVEGAMTEMERRETDAKPPEQLRWIRQKQTMRLFDALIYNFDRNRGNMLIDTGWKLWFIDHTRSFRRSAEVDKLEKIIWCERGIFERLQALDKKTLSRQLRGLISGPQVGLLLKRRDKLVDHLRSRIEQVGESAVLFEASKPGEVSADILELVDDDIPMISSKLEDPDVPGR